MHEHYLEVDSLLSGELPSAIVQSFAGRHRPEWPGDSDNGTPVPSTSSDLETPTGWSHVSSRVDAWKVQKKRDSIENVLGKGNGVTNLNDEFVGDEERDIGHVHGQGEESRLLPENIEEREARRERIARLALNGEPSP